MITYRTSSVKIDVFQCNRSKLIVPQPREVQLSHFALCRTSLVSRRRYHLNRRYGSITGNMQQDTATILYIYIYIYMSVLFMLAVPHHIKYPISPISSEQKESWRCAVFCWTVGPCKWTTCFMPKVSTCFHVTSTPFFMLAVPYQHASNPLLGADQGGIEWGGGGGGPRVGLYRTMRQTAQTAQTAHTAQTA